MAGQNGYPMNAEAHVVQRDPMEVIATAGSVALSGELEGSINPIKFDSALI